MRQEELDRDEDVLCNPKMAYGIILDQAVEVNSSHLCCCDDGFLGDNISLVLTITGNQTWESALAETRSPIARTFDARTRVEIELLMKKALGDRLIHFK